MQLDVCGAAGVMGAGVSSSHTAHTRPRGWTLRGCGGAWTQQPAWPPAALWDVRRTRALEPHVQRPSVAKWLRSAVGCKQTAVLLGGSRRPPSRSRSRFRHGSKRLIRRDLSTPSDAAAEGQQRAKETSGDSAEPRPGREIGSVGAARRGDKNEKRGEAWERREAEQKGWRMGNRRAPRAAHAAIPS